MKNYKLTPEEYNRILKTIQLSWLALDSMKSEINREAFEDRLKIESTYSIGFESSLDISDDFFSIYKNHGLIMNVWPFFRELVFDQTARMNIKPIPLPLIKH